MLSAIFDWLIRWGVTILVLSTFVLFASLLHGQVVGIPARIPSVHDGDTVTAEFDAKISVMGRGDPEIRIILPIATYEGVAYSGYREFPIRVRIRLDKCWAPELDERGGKASRDSLKRMAEGKVGVLLLDFSKTAARGKTDINISRMITLNRFVGDFLVPPYKHTVGERQVRSKHAKEAK